MEGIIFIGIQASGKSSFYKEKFFDTHVRISMDLLNTRNKESQLLEKCLDLQQRVVVDNTNPTIAERKVYIKSFKVRKYSVVAYYFQSSINAALARNENRVGKQKIDTVGILSTYNKLQLPLTEEGFDRIYYVQIEGKNFTIKEWIDEI